MRNMRLYYFHMSTNFNQDKTRTILYEEKILISAYIPLINYTILNKKNKNVKGTLMQI